MNSDIELIKSILERPFDIDTNGVHVCIFLREDPFYQICFNLPEKHEEHEMYYSTQSFIDFLEETTMQDIYRDLVYNSFQRRTGTLQALDQVTRSQVYTLDEMIRMARLDDKGNK